MKSVLLAVLIGTTSSAMAMEQGNDPFDINIHPESVSVNTSLGWLAGGAKEYVYDPDTGHKDSQLDWKINNAAIIKGDISWDAFSWLTLNARGWTTLASGNGHLDDYDWMKEDQAHWTDWSTHKNTPLNYANEFDLNLKSWLIKQPSYKLAVMAGYQQNRFSWSSFGGSYQYENGEDVGEFPAGVKGIGYQQKFSSAYMGLAGQYRYQDIEFNGSLKFSPFVRAKDQDEHYSRDLTFRGKTTQSRFYSATVDAGYYITPKTKVFAELAINHFTKGKGNSMITDNNSGMQDESGDDSIGMSNTSYNAALGVQYRF